jgi:hypothetical protein
MSYTLYVVFETVRLVGSDEVEIPVYTRRNRAVHNSQPPAVVDERLREKYARLLAAHPTWEPRKVACGVYNCSGHVWASRRTAIYDQPEIDKILNDDGYRTFRDGEQPALGDLILYYMGESFCHVGIVFELRSINLPGLPVIMPGVVPHQPTPWILSKWDDTSGEVFHHWQHVPWPDIRTQFRTDRP